MNNKKQQFIITPSEILTDTSIQLLTIEELGCHIKLLAMAQLANGELLLASGSPMTTKHIARLLGMTENKAQEVIDALVSVGCWMRRDNGALYNQKIIDAKKEEEEKRRARSERAKLGIRNKRANAQHMSSTCSAQEEQMLSRCSAGAQHNNSRCLANGEQMLGTCYANGEQMLNETRADAHQVLSKCSTDGEQMVSRCSDDAQYMPSKCSAKNKRVRKANLIDGEEMLLQPSTPTLPTSEQEAIDMLAGMGVPDDFVITDYYQLSSSGWNDWKGNRITSFRNAVLAHYRRKQNKENAERLSKPVNKDPEAWHEYVDLTPSLLDVDALLKENTDGNTKEKVSNNI